MVRCQIIYLVHTLRVAHKGLDDDSAVSVCHRLEHLPKASFILHNAVDVSISRLRTTLSFYDHGILKANFFEVIVDGRNLVGCGHLHTVEIANRLRYCEDSSYWSIELIEELLQLLYLRVSIS